MLTGLSLFAMWVNNRIFYLYQMVSLTEENYLKTLYRLAGENQEISVKNIAESLNIKMPTVNSMVKKLAEKVELVAGGNRR